MPFPLKLEPSVEKDIAMLFDWYEEQQQGLGMRLVAELKITLEKLETHPLYYGYIKKPYRAVALKKFPVIIIFECPGAEVIIYAVQHSSRRFPAAYC